MPKHAFKFPAMVVKSVKKHIQDAIDSLPPKQYRQEANYTAALMGKIKGIAYEGEHGEVTISTTVFDDRGPGSAESKYGADFAITAVISDGKTRIEKAILVQVKLGRISELSKSKEKSLKDQIEKMRRVVRAPKVMEIPEKNGKREPAIISGNRILEGSDYRAMRLPDYVVARITTTLDGCTDQGVVKAVKDSSLPLLRFHASIRT